jgi:amino acid transporter
MDVTTSTSFINFGAFLAFTAVNVSVIALYLKRDPAVRPLGIIIGIIVPVLAALCDLMLLANLDNNAKILGVVWLAVGIVYLGYLTRFFQTAPPEMDFAE